MVAVGSVLSVPVAQAGATFSIVMPSHLRLQHGHAATLTATVVDENGVPVTGGNILFYATNGNWNSWTVYPVVNGSATLTTTTRLWPVGGWTITASYPVDNLGEGNPTASATAIVTVR
jgi:hypothetical protein